ncbi:MAG TPA: hypothetical protein VK864_08245 [Longimicrobiales bacterium]|nr:hypothetical protein [Longimicrobiales bacterium]
MARWRPARPRRLGLITLWLMAAGCGGNPEDQTAEQPADSAPSPAAAANRNACSLLTPAEVEAVIGSAVRDSLALQMAQGSGTGALSQCNYATASDPAVVSVMLNSSPEGNFTAVAQDGVRGSLKESGVTVEEVAGLGEVAFWAGGQLHVFVNRNWYFIVSSYADQGRQHAEALARRALPRLL